MRNKKILSIILVVIFSINLQLFAQNDKSLPRSVPEKEGVSSEGILKFLDAISKSKHEFHSFMFLRHGKVIAEGWWNPYRPELKHTLYSVSKSFTSTAIGFAVSEKLISVNDKVIKFFPKDLPDTISENLKSLEIKDLLSMSAGQDPDPTSSIRNWNTNWVKSFLAVPIINKPGSKFLYNSVATFMLSAIIQKVTGQKLIDYLKPRLFDPLGIEGMDWEINPMNINTGGWGLRIKTEDLAKFGLLYLQNGKWNGKQIIPEEWVKEATTLKILQSPEATAEQRNGSDWLQGYCYKFWRCRYNAFRGDGAFGQFIIMMPDQDAVVAITAESMDLQGELNLVWEYLLPSIKKEEIPIDASLLKRLETTLNSLSLPLYSDNGFTHEASMLNGKEYLLQPNSKGIEKISFQFLPNESEITFKIDTSTYKIKFGSGRWIEDETFWRGPGIISNAKFSLFGLPASKIAGNYYWKYENTIELILRYIESPHTERITCQFVEDEIKIEIANSFESKNQNIVIEGHLIEK